MKLKIFENVADIFQARKTISELKKKLNAYDNDLNRALNCANELVIHQKRLEDQIVKLEVDITDHKDWINDIKSEKNYYIWSNEHKAWWKPNQLGYTIILNEAGKYTREEALKISRGRIGWDTNSVPNEIPVKVEDVTYLRNDSKV